MISDEGFSDKDMLLIDKPKDYTSAKVVNIIRKRLGIKKAGHSGTLDPKATGLMIVCTGTETKRLSELLDADKEYEGVMVIGATTKTFDTESEVINVKDLTGFRNLPGLVRETARSFIGEIEQIPPMYSSVKFRGKPLYKYARKDREVERKPRKVLVKSFEICDILLPEIKFKVSCSKGTYIRSLVNDFGEKLGTGAYLKELRRTRIGEYDVKDAVKLESLETIEP